MTDVRVSVIYYSSTGTVHAMARRLASAAEEAGARVRLRQVPELAPEEAIASNAAWSQHFDDTKNEPKAVPDDIVEADAVLLGTPTRYGNVSSQLKQFIDTLGPQWSQGMLADKVYAGFTATMTAHGGQESTLLALYNTIYHFGGLVVAPGYTDPSKFADGNPYGVSHVTGGTNSDPLTDVQYTALDHMARRVVTIAGRLKAGAAG
ncbi:NAD(P)H:quinone oxidoreductase type IV [Planomonospora parontospora subsp. parontospora]|uniref:NAD(P)H:quinone oxidoreductase type IV n=2 Tax=Planomonospora parontospora TaxID=58119 RepID=A0AA37F277_9ACTN|nr:NAD(P)H:quinone oxidoreductase [Planomonospora parontospora]GGK46932.1 NAD(P)H:quinone oxidoreductase type IV [Planomonospora parontospora]GII06539.1 NAD(P)H:quinone oxidoreductase type IV [Planomonospora parontospora subsp. parontospora]